MCINTNERKNKMMEKSTKRTYESPKITLTRVEIEGTFASSIDEKKITVKTETQDYQEFDADAWGEGKNDAGIKWE